MITTMAAYPAALQDLPPLGQTGLTDASMNDNNNNNNNNQSINQSYTNLLPKIYHKIYQLTGRRDI